MEVHENRKYCQCMDTCGESDYGMMCQKYSILQCTLPIHFTHERNGQTCVCCALCDICHSVVPFE